MIVTFYSYKGGVGRTLALSRIARVLALNYGKKVLAVDWDFEAPGLGYYFGLTKRELSERKGLFDYFEEYVAAWEKAERDETVSPVEIGGLARPVALPQIPGGPQSRGWLSLITAGRQDASFAERVARFDWERFYEERDGFAAVEYLRKSLEDIADTVLIDSRTGVAAASDICTLQLPDVICAVFSPNRQNLDGVEDLMAAAHGEGGARARPKGREKPKFLLVPSRVSSEMTDAAKNWLDAAMGEYGERWKSNGFLLEANHKEGLTTYLLPYRPEYAFDETQPPFAAGKPADDELANRHFKLTAGIVDFGKVGEAGETNYWLGQLNYAKTTQDWSAIAFAEFKLGEAFLREGKNEEALGHLEKAMELFEVLRNADGQEAALVRLVRVKGELGRHDGALKDLERLLEMKKDFNDFLRYLHFGPKAGDPTTIGMHLADALRSKGVKRAKEHQGRIGALREELKTLNSPTMDAVIETLEKEEHFCAVLTTEPGLKWVSSAEDKGGASKSPKDLESPVRKLLSGLKKIEAGPFQMGGDGVADNPPHEVTLSESFEIGATPVTQAQYEAVMGGNPSRFKGPDHPVESVSWRDAMMFCERLSKETGRAFTLPTEAQWEYACRAGRTTKFNFGDDEKALAKYAWFEGNSGGGTHPVAEKKPNAWGLCDMHGNVWEWCLDWYGELTKDPQTDPKGPETGAYRVVRGGSWSYDARCCRSAYRGMCVYEPESRVGNVGFRVLAVPAVEK